MVVLGRISARRAGPAERAGCPTRRFAAAVAVRMPATRADFEVSVAQSAEGQEQDFFRRPILPSTPSQGNEWVTRVPAAHALIVWTMTNPTIVASAPLGSPLERTRRLAHAA
jgi:hypothetical protein